jgi:hypothetical protein
MHSGLMIAYLQGGEHGMCLADDAHDNRSLLDGFLCVFNLEDAALRRAVLVSETFIRHMYM